MGLNIDALLNSVFQIPGMALGKNCNSDPFPSDTP